MVVVAHFDSLSARAQTTPGRYVILRPQRGQMLQLVKQVPRQTETACKSPCQHDPNGVRYYSLGRSPKTQKSKNAIHPERVRYRSPVDRFQRFRINKPNNGAFRCRDALLCLHGRKSPSCRFRAFEPMFPEMTTLPTPSTVQHQTITSGVLPVSPP